MFKPGKVLLLKGLPASGKTTRAKSLVDSGHYARVNRDDLREMIFNSRWSHMKEKTIIKCEQALAEILSKDGYNVVVDDTNFKNAWTTITHEIEEFNTSVEECIRRDALRAKTVGRNVITKMALRNGLVKWPEAPIVLCDIDGTLAQETGRRKHLEKEPKDWKSYYEELDSDTPVEHIFKWVKALSEDHTIVVVSGRGAEWEEDTLDWFRDVWSWDHVPRFPVFQWIFRDRGDHRPDDIVKEEFLKLLPRKPVLVIDDRPRVVRMWRKNGIRVIPVAGECAEF